MLDEVTKIVKDVSKDYEINIGNYNHVTVELFYEESENLLRYFREFNIATVDMELSSLYRLARYFGKKAIGILRVGDRPLHREEYWSEKHKMKEERKNKGKEVIFKIIEKFLEE